MNEGEGDQAGSALVGVPASYIIKSDIWHVAISQAVRWFRGSTYQVISGADESVVGLSVIIETIIETLGNAAITPNFNLHHPRGIMIGGHDHYPTIK